MKTPTICHLTSVHYVFDVRIFHKQCKTLVKSGYRVILVAQHDSDMEIDGVNILALQNPQNRVYRMIFLTFAIFLKAIRQKADIYHFHDPELLIIGLLLRLLGKKTIYDVHEDVPRDILAKEWINISLRAKIAAVFEKFEDWASRRMSAIVAATPYIRDRFLKSGCKVVDVNNFPIRDELFTSGTDWSQKRKAVFFAGGISPIRSIFEMIEAVGRTDAVLFLAGRFTPPSLREQAVAMRGWAHVRELGYIGRNEIKRHLSISMAGLSIMRYHPNLVNGLPIKMFEYMSASIPVIASRFPLWEEIVEGNKCGICVDPEDPASIAHAIRWVIENPAEAEVMGTTGRRMVEEKYNWENESVKLLKLYEEILS